METGYDQECTALIGTLYLPHNCTTACIEP